MQYARMLPLIAIAAFSIPLLTGCGGNVQVGGEFSCGGGNPCTYGGHASATINFDVPALSADDLSQGRQYSYVVAVDVPTNELKPVSSVPTQTTINAVTSLGYQSSTIVTMSYAGSTPSTVHAGYTTYSYTLPASSSLTDWLNNLTQNAGDSVQLSGSTTALFAPQGIPGSYSIYFGLSSAQLGNAPTASAGFIDPGVDGSSSPCPNLRPCQYK